jgi:hypothetical protein
VHVVFSSGFGVWRFDIRGHYRELPCPDAELVPNGREAQAEVEEAARLLDEEVPEVLGGVDDPRLFAVAAHLVVDAAWLIPTAACVLIWLVLESISEQKSVESSN